MGPSPGRPLVSNHVVFHHAARAPKLTGMRGLVEAVVAQQPDPKKGSENQIPYKQMMKYIGTHTGDIESLYVSYSLNS